MWHPRDHLGIPHLHSTTKRWFLRFGAAPKIAVLHCWSSVYSTLLWGESPFTIVLIVIIPLYPHHSIILSAYLLYQTMVYVILSSLSQRESSQYANNLIWTPRFYGNLHQFSHGTARHLGYVGMRVSCGLNPPSNMVNFLPGHPRSQPPASLALASLRISQGT